MDFKSAFRLSIGCLVFMVGMEGWRCGLDEQTLCIGRWLGYESVLFPSLGGVQFIGQVAGTWTP